MKNRVLILGLATVLNGALPAQAKLNVVATLPDFGSIAQAIGGDNRAGEIGETLLAHDGNDEGVTGQ